MPRVAQPGFTLFEVILVITLLVVCSTLGFISYTSLRTASFVGDGAVLSLLLRTASTRARALNHEQTIIIDELHDALLYDGNRYPLQEGFRFGVLADTYGPPSQPDKLVVKAISFVDKKIIAYPDGVLQSGTLYITDGQQQYAVTTPVSAFSYIRIYRYRNKVWQIY